MRQDEWVLKGLAALVIRGVLLWVVVPTAIVAWFVAALPLAIRGTRVGPRHFVRWCDLQLIAAVCRLVHLEPGPPFVGLTSARVDAHRVRLGDLS
jgi:hypothetical protein